MPLTVYITDESIQSDLPLSRRNASALSDRFHDFEIGSHGVAYAGQIAQFGHQIDHM